MIHFTFLKTDISLKPNRWQYKPTGAPNPADPGDKF